MSRSVEARGRDALEPGASEPSARAVSQSVRVRPSLLGAGSSLIGRSLIGLAAGAAILGGVLGLPGASPREGAPLGQADVVAPRGTEVGALEARLDTALARVLPGTDARAVLEQVGHVSFSLRLDRGIIGPDGNGPHAAPGTRLHATLDRSGVTFSSSPGVSWNLPWLPDPTVRSIRYDFRESAFLVRAEGWGPDELYSAEIADQLALHLKPLLPEAIRTPGYDPWRDPALSSNLQAMIDMLLRPSAGSGAASLDVAAALDPLALSAPAFELSYVVPETQTVRLADPQASATLAAGTRIVVGAETDGRIDQPRISRVRVDFASSPLRLVQGDDPGSVLRRLDLHAVTVRPGAELDVDYQLGAEQAADGIHALITLLAVAAEPRLVHSASGAPMSGTRFETFRGEVQGQIDAKLEPALRRLLAEHDAAIPGFSLLQLFGLPGPTPAR